MTGTGSIGKLVNSPVPPVSPARAAARAGTEIKYLPGSDIRTCLRARIVRILSNRPGQHVCEVGGGAKPLLSLAEVERLGAKYAILDISRGELDKAPADYEKVCADIADPAFTSPSRYDLVFSHMLAEHIARPQTFHANVKGQLVPGGTAVHLFPTLYAPPFVANRVLPHRVSAYLLRRLDKGRDFAGVEGKFKAYYRWCRGPTASQLARFRRLGYDVSEYIGFYGTPGYWERLRLEHFDDWLAQKLTRYHVPYLTGYALVTLKVPEDQRLQESR